MSLQFKNNNDPKTKFLKIGILSISISFLIFLLCFLIIDDLRYRKEQILGEIKNIDDFTLSLKNVSKINSSILKIDEEIKNLNFLIKSSLKLIPDINKKMKYLEFASNLSKGSDILVNAINESFRKKNLIEKLEVIKNGILNSKEYFQNSKEILSELNFEEFKDSGIKEKIENILELVLNLDKDIENLETILGKNSFQRYLLLFQNTNELRPTGGFTGSFAILEIENGEIKNFYFPGEGTYLFKGLLKEKVQSPMPLWFVGRVWSLHDANFYPDFPSSSQKILWFLEKSEFPSCDGVIAINSDFFEKILKITGPIDVPEYNITLTSKDAISKLQKIIESDTERSSGKPKKILTKILPILLKSLSLNNLENLDKNKIFNLSSLLINSLNTRDIQIYFQRDDLEDWVRKKGWAGEIKDFKNYLNINIANVGGGKNSRVIENKFNLDISYKNGFLYNKIIIKRYHKGSKNPLENTRNISYIRIYVPINSEILYFNGENLINYEDHFKKLKKSLPYDKDLLTKEKNWFIDKKKGLLIFDSFNKKVYSFFMWLNPKEEKEVEILYKFPILTEDLKTFSYYIQKQSGLEIKGNIKFEIPENYDILRIYKLGDADIQIFPDEVKIFSDFKNDLWVGMVLNSGF